MKTRQTDADSVQHRPEAETGRTAPHPLRSLHDAASDQRHALQRVVDASPRIQAQGFAIQAAFGDALHRRSLEANALPNRTGMPDRLKAGIESLSGMDMSQVRVYANSAMPAQLNALAYAQGNDIHLGPGQEHHLPHEAWHVVQQRQGRVQATMQMAGWGVNDDAALESEADAMGARAASGAAPRPAQGGERHSQAQPGPRPSAVRGGEPIQRVRFLSVKRVAQNGSLYEGLNGAGPPQLAHNGGLTWWGPLASAQLYAVPAGSTWRSTAATALNLVDMNTPATLGKTMRATIRRTNGAVSAALQNVLMQHNFAYALPRAVATTAQMCLDYAHAEFARHNGQWVANEYVAKADVDMALGLAQNAGEIQQLVGSVIQVFADHSSVHALQLDDANFLANPDNYVIFRKDATNLDAAFADALLGDLNQPAMAGSFHGLHVPAGMKFGGFTGTAHEILVRNSPVNLNPPVAAQVGDPAMQVSDKTLGVDDSLLARAWRWFGWNN